MVNHSLPDPSQDIVAVYLRRIGEIPLFTPEGERQEFTRLRELEHRVTGAYCQYARGVLLEAREREVLPVSARVAQKFEVSWDILTARQQRDLTHQVESAMKDTSFYVSAGQLHDIYGEAVEPGRRPHHQRHLRVDRPGRRVIPREYGSDLQQRNHVTDANLRLVVSIARRDRHPGMAFIDILGEGNVGLLKAVERFDPERGNKFSTYAMWWIRQAIKRGTEEKGLTVRVPTHVHEARRYLMRGYGLAQQIYGQDDISVSEAVAAFNDHSGLKSKLTLSEAERALLSVHDPKSEVLSLEAPISEEDDTSLEEVFRSDPALDDRTLAVDPEQAAIDSSIATSLREGLGYLSPIEYDIVISRFGVAGRKEETLEELGQRYHLSRERIRQLQNQGLRKMRNFLGRRGVTGV